MAGAGAQLDQLRRRIAASAVAAAIWLVLVPSAVAAPGDLDPSFGTGGIREVDFTVTDHAIQDDGKVVAVGSTYIRRPGGGHRWTVHRLLADGGPDPSFGEDGEAETPFSSEDTLAKPQAGLVQPDGKIVVAGFAWGQAALVRYLPDGSLDESFSGDGIALTNLGTPDSSIADIALASDGAIVAAGKARSVSDPYFRNGFRLARFMPNGELDPSFGEHGFVFVEFKGYEGGAASSVRLEPDGRIVAAGSAHFDDCCWKGMPFLTSELAFARFEPDGSADPSFGSDGKVSGARGSGSAPLSSILALPDGDYLVVGTGSVDGAGAVVGRFDSSGALDPSFSGRGFTAVRGLVTAGDVVRDAANSFLVGGGSATDQTSRDLGLARLNDDGSADMGFGDGGLVRTDIDGGRQEVSSLVLQPDGKVVVSGGSVVARYLLASGAPDADADGILDPDDTCTHAYGPLPSGCPLHRREISAPTLENAKPSGQLTDGRPEHSRARSGRPITGLAGTGRSSSSSSNVAAPTGASRSSARAARGGIRIFDVPPPNKGRYYFRAPAATSGHVGRCGKARSGLLEVERHIRVVEYDSLRARGGFLRGKLAATAKRCVKRTKVTLRRGLGRSVRIARTLTDRKGRFRFRFPDPELSYYEVALPRTKRCERLRTDAFTASVVN